MSGSRPNSAERLLAEQHLGDRLAALVDGELGHESRDRVLAHLATCAKCKAEADAQRRLKNVFAEAAPPPPSESFLARLQGLPGGGTSDDGRSPGGAFGVPGGSGAFGARRSERFEFSYVPVRPHSSVLPAAASADRGFRIHDVSRHEAERSASRGMRFAFAAAGAVSLAAIALGGVTGGVPSDTAADARGGTGTGSNVTPARTQGSGAVTGPETQRRRGSLLAQGLGQRSTLGHVPAAASTAVSAPLLPGITAAGAGLTEEAVDALTAPVMAGAAVMSPLIRPFSASPPLTLTSWSRPGEFTAPGLLATPVPDATSSPSSSAFTR
ncbi:zf-HC2 domain-containing protein [Streptomyces sp. NPDC005574]|uniref:anti-sigma factor family protein n=1 Tax=Streptomyces sp. NPDC005574 TaxID=3156891 RepID=UPI0033BA65C4